MIPVLVVTIFLAGSKPPNFPMSIAVINHVFDQLPPYLLADSAELVCGKLSVCMSTGVFHFLLVLQVNTVETGGKGFTSDDLPRPISN